MSMYIKHYNYVILYRKTQKSYLAYLLDSIREANMSSPVAAGSFPFALTRFLTGAKEYQENNI